MPTQGSRYANLFKMHCSLPWGPLLLHPHFTDGKPRHREILVPRHTACEWRSWDSSQSHQAAVPTGVTSMFECHAASQRWREKDACVWNTATFGLIICFYRQKNILEEIMNSDYLWEARVFLITRWKNETLTFQLIAFCTVSIYFTIIMCWNNNNKNQFKKS